ncbi:MAG: hypothetical protein GEU93_18405 [Propionibacteriales bacterium]|nr:hypothetical protein [Propionibacteriales bacterium]
MPVYENLKTPTPVYAAVGAGELVVEKIRDARSDAQDRLSKLNVEPKMPESASERVTKMTEDVKSVAADVRAVPSKAQSTVNDLVSQAGSTYDDLAARGKELVDRIREEQVDLQTQVKRTIERVKGGPTSAPQNGTSTAKRTKSTGSTGTSTARKPAAKKTTKSTAKKSAAKKTTK